MTGTVIEYVTLGGEKRTYVLPPPGSKRMKAPMVKQHQMDAVWPDGTEVTIEYEREGPYRSTLIFRPRDVKYVTLARLYPAEGPKTLPEIEALIRRRTLDGFFDVVYEEQKWTLKRASPPTDAEKKALDRKTYTMKADQAKEHAGKYAICELRGEKYCPVSPAYEKISEPVAWWEQVQQQHIEARQTTAVENLYLCGCCRWKRQWVRLRWDPLRSTEGVCRMYRIDWRRHGESCIHTGTLRYRCIEHALTVLDVYDRMFGYTTDHWIVPCYDTELSGASEGEKTEVKVSPSSTPKRPRKTSQTMRTNDTPNSTTG